MLNTITVLMKWFELTEKIESIDKSKLTPEDFLETLRNEESSLVLFSYLNVEGYSMNKIEDYCSETLEAGDYDNYIEEMLQGWYTLTGNKFEKVG